MVTWPIATLNSEAAAKAVAVNVQYSCMEGEGHTQITTDGADLVRRSAATLEPLQQIQVSERIVSAVANLANGDLLTAEVDT